MSLKLKILLSVVAVFVIFAVSVIGYVISTNNTLVAQEQGIKAQYDQNKNNYDNYFKKLKEVCQVPDMYRDDLKKVYDSVMAGRYGNNGSKAVFQWIQEHNPNFDSSIYKQIQQVIESGRNDFEMNQKMLIDKKRVYETVLRTFPRSVVAKILGFPKIDLTKFDIVTSETTEQVFKDKKSEPMKLR